MFKLIPYLKDFKKECFLGPLFKLLEAILELIVPLVMAKIIDIGVKSYDTSYIIKMGILIIILGIVGLGSALVCQYFAAKASQGFGTKLRNELFHHINSLSHSEIDNIGTPSLITRIINDVNQLQVAVAMAIRLGVRAPFIILGSAIMAMFINLKLSLIFFLSIPLIVLTLYLVMGKAVPLYRVIQKKLDKISLITRENLDGVRVVRAFSKQEVEKNRFNIATLDHSNTAIKVGKLSALLNPLTFMIMNFSIAFIVWFGGIGVNNGNFTQGEIIAFVNYMTQILLTLIVVANLVIIFTKASASATRVNEVLDTKSSIKEASSSTKVQATNNSSKIIEFKNVSFSYNNSKQYSLENISLSINKGETIGIIGGTGAGKSTLVNLMPRFYESTEGEIFINGENIKNYSIKDLRNLFGIVPQKAVLFTGSLRENMKWANKNASDEEILMALDIAQCSDFVSNLKDGLDTAVLQGGKNFSGGQKQRLTIARALVGSPKIIILDDSSSALDFATDLKLRQALNTHAKEITTIIVSQRASSIKNSDKIVVLDDGKLAGIGTHEELLENSEVYKEICLSQLTREEAYN
ncbi:ABC transporter ATP-binding protein [Clostridium paraputrificum]|uniref:ABC transporter ATP-binding protein n=1 Tax=Clostridium TaxID=1485 RepID=UPI00189F9FBE|nr:MULTISPECIES: ABC transporter ATP-binding protein [Clostridium]MBS7131325.1 ABC transporter ATP-binding protein [Clostridium sp.]MDB2076310.1 ABC transporter ATP-binding protein [Clostridium paraputrificum]MDB2079752.1 ABC transporter ATP-binding protein [Clostridium paraputrificum]MDB2086166.1 ABC transporter ATP-binding protein [Clostridium paraputrificum]MDB2094072.1 ABC transporter ATP-binding protein [Clostridium paraputrificum]